MSSQPHSQTSYDLGELIQEYPVNVRGIIFTFLFLGLGSIAIMVFGLYLNRNDMVSVGSRFLEFPTVVVVGTGFAAMLAITCIIPITQIILATKTPRAVLNPPPDLYSKKGSLFAFPLIIALSVMLFVNMGIGTMLLGGMGLLAALSMLILMLRYQGQHLLIFECGLVVPVKGKPVAVHWEDVNAVWVRGNDGHIGCYNGTYLPIESIWSNSAHALTYINKMVAEKLNPGMLKNYDAGEVVRFGRLGISKQGLIFRQSTIPWQQIDSIEVTALGISTRQGNNLHKLRGITAHDIPNLPFFLILTSHILSPTKAEQAFLQEIPEEKPSLADERLREFKPSVRSPFFPTFWLLLGMLCIILDWSNNYPSGSFHVAYLGIPMILLALYKLIAWLQCFGVRIQVSNDALVYNRFKKARVFQWSDFKEIRMYFVAVWQVLLVHRYDLTTTDGGVISLRQGLWHVELLGDYVQKQINALLVPHLEELVKKGERVSFGQWSISQQGIHDKDKVLPWEEIEEILVKPRVVIVRKKGQRSPWTRIPCMGTPNLGAFLLLTKQPVKYEMPVFRAS